MKRFIKNKKALANVAGAELTIRVIGTATEIINDEFVNLVDYEVLCNGGDWEYDCIREDKIQIIKYINDKPKTDKPKTDKPKFKDVRFTKCEEYFMGEYKTFWRADYKPNSVTFQWETLATARTKAECMKEAREQLKSL